MDLPHRNIRFTSTDDGVDIAFWELGEGKPAVILNNFGISHSELEWGVPSIASFYTDMAERYRVIRFDPRGISLSGEPPGGWGAVTASGAQQGMSTLEMGFDISAVAAALELDSFALIGVNVQGPVAIEYAATHSEVSELILCNSFAAVSASHMAPFFKAEAALDKIRIKAGPVMSPWERVSQPDEVGRLMNLVRERKSHYPQEIYLGQAAQAEWDAEAFLDRVSVPTLIISTRSPIFNALSDARHLAAGITGAQLSVVGGTFSPYWSERAATLKAIDALLEPEAPRPRFAPSVFRTVVFTDIVGSTEYVRQVDDDAGRVAVRELEDQVATLAANHGGRIVKNLGDGSLVSFGSNSAAIRFALEVKDKCNDGPLKLRLGMSAGEPIQEDGDIHGTVVAHASRIADLGGAGEVIVSDSVRQLAKGKGFSFEPKGEVTLKGFDEPERIWNVTHK